MVATMVVVVMMIVTDGGSCDDSDMCNFSTLLDPFSSSSFLISSCHLAFGTISDVGSCGHHLHLPCVDPHLPTTDWLTKMLVIIDDSFTSLVGQCIQTVRVMLHKNVLVQLVQLTQW